VKTDEDVDIEEEIRAIESVRLLPKPAKIKCDYRAQAEVHMLSGGVIEYVVDGVRCQRKIVAGVHCLSRNGESFYGTLPFLTDAFYLSSLDRLEQVAQLYRTLYLLPIEE
jgi:hypothetical protein